MRLSEEEWHPAQPLPTTIHLDVLANGAIPDPYIAKNEELVQWVGERTWIYETTFSVPEYLRQDQKRRIALVMEGLDTFATMTLNGRDILKSSNMFLTHRVDITEQIRAASGQQNAAHRLRQSRGTGRRVGTTTPGTQLDDLEFWHQSLGHAESTISLGECLISSVGATSTC
jgi:beta-mannosidase